MENEVCDESYQVVVALLPEMLLAHAGHLEQYIPVMRFRPARRPKLDRVVKISHPTKPMRSMSEILH